jgi:hypothetical protein
MTTSTSLTHTDSFEYDNLRDIIYENINEHYGRGKYAGLEVIIMKKNGYVNATKLCQLGGKELKHWNRSDSAFEL